MLFITNIKLYKWLPALLLFIGCLANLSCKKCEGEGPKFSPEDKQLLTDLKQGDSLVFRSNAGARMYLYVYKREFWEPKDGNKADPPFKGSVNCSVDDNAEAAIHLSTMNSATVSDEVFVISLRKSIIATDVIFSGSMLRGSAITRSTAPDLDSLTVNGITYRDIFTLQPDLSSLWQVDGPKTLKLYYTKYNGLIRFENEGNEIWERIN